MSIVSSVVESDAVQKDGRRWIHEIHTDHLGLKYDRMWLAQAADNAATALAAYAGRLAADITAGEIASNVSQVMGLGSLASPVLNYSTAAQNFAGLRAAYLIATRTDAIMIGDFLSTLTDGQLQTAFSLTAGQVTTLRTNKLSPAVSLASSIRAAAGQ